MSVPPRVARGVKRRRPQALDRETGRRSPMRRAARATLALSLFAALLFPRASRAQEPPPAAGPVQVPWSVGERMRYDVRFGIIKAGTGEMQVMGIESIRGRPAWHGRFTVHGGYLALRVDDVLDTWMDLSTLSSLRFAQDFSEIGRDRQKTFEIFPEKATYLQVGKSEKPSVAQPLDDGSFLYFIRTVPLVVGQSYEFNRYFIPDRNPVRIRVLRREQVRVPAGTFSCIVLQPIIKTKGIFSENGQAEIWLTDDARRIMVQMKTKLPFGSLNLYLRSFSVPAPEGSK
ncbi:MAG: DUF3108 domain-containing protein [Gemmatimonadota bacterium]|nr:DUF3108 domain-containing protein [Gemmatimonadota bacterium]